MHTTLLQVQGYWYHLIRPWIGGDVPIESDWSDWARRLPRSAFVIWLAGHVADDLKHCVGYRVSVQQLVDAIDDDSTGLLQHKAERFIEQFYFGYPSSDPKLYRLIRIFRRIVKRRLNRHQMKN